MTDSNNLFISQDKKALAEALSTLLNKDFNETASLLARPKDPTHGDWAFPCFSMAKEKRIAPPVVAEEIKKSLTLPPLFSHCEVKGGYLNFSLDRTQWCKAVVKEILGDKPNSEKLKNTGKIVVEFSSPNIAKVFHVGHLRTTLIGACLDRVLRYQGYDVHSCNYIGDWGTQFGFVYAGCELWGKPKDATVEGLVDLYVKASTLRKQQDDEKEGPVPEEDKDKPNVNELARSYFIRLEAGDKDAVAFWEWCLNISLAYFKKMYGRLNIDFDDYNGEAYYRDHIPAVEKLILESDVLEESRGSKGVDLGKELGFARIFTEDGRSLYVTRDIACAIDRNERFTPEKILYIVAAQQTLHFKQLKGIMEKLKHPVAEKIIHIPFGFVPGMKTRAGGGISLEHFLNEAQEHALTAYRTFGDKRPEGVDEMQVSEAVSIGATYFYFLNHSNIKDFQFTWDEALNFQGDSGPYVQYAYARLCSIQEKALAAGLKPSTESLDLLLTDEQAFSLIKILSQFEEVVDSVARTYEPHYLAEYLLACARQFASSYKNMRVIGEEKNLAEARLALFSAVQERLKVGMKLLGVPAIEKM